MDRHDHPSAQGDDDALYDPPPLKPEFVRPPIVVAEVLRRDVNPPADVLFDDAQVRIGTDPIPASRYFSPEYAELEKKHLWPKVWQFAVWGEDIPNPGDIHVYRILDKSVLIVRQRDRSVKAFLNACLHRGRELCEEHTHQSELKCPYHYFTWGLEGQLKWTPSKWDFPQVDEAKFRLPEVRVEEWNGFYFVNFDKDAISLHDFMGPRWHAHWKTWDFSKRYKAAHVVKKLKANWKTGQDAFIEGFHAFASHSQGAIANADDCSQVDIYEDSPNMSRFHIVTGYPSPRLDPPPPPELTFGRMMMAYATDIQDTPEGVMKEGEDSRAASARVIRQSFSNRWKMDLTNISTSDTLDAISYFMFPNFMPWGGLANPLVYRFTPGETPDECIWETMLFHPYEGERPPSAETIYKDFDESLLDIEALGRLALVLHQDDQQLPAVQRGMKNLANGELVITEYQELRIRHFHKLLGEWVGE